MPFVSDKNKFVHWPPPDANNFYRYASNLYRFFIYLFSSVVQSCPTLCDPMDCSTPDLPVHHQLLEFTRIHVHWVSDAIQPSHPVIPFSSSLQSFPESGSFQMSQFFTSGGQSIGVSASSVLPMNIQDWFPLSSSMKSLAMMVFMSYWVCLDLVLTSTLSNHASSSSADVFELFSVLNSFLILKCQWAENVLKIVQSASFSFLSFQGAFLN